MHALPDLRLGEWRQAPGDGFGVPLLPVWRGVLLLRRGHVTPAPWTAAGGGPGRGSVVVIDRGGASRGCARMRVRARATPDRGAFGIMMGVFRGVVGVVLKMRMMERLVERGGGESPSFGRPSANPPKPATILPGQLALLLTESLAELCTTLVFLLPELGAVIVPVAPELGGEGLGQEKQPDVVPSRTEVLLHQAGVRVHVIGRLVELPTTPFFRCRAVDVMVISDGRWEEGRG